MSTYEELLKYGTNVFSTNANLKAAFDAQDEAYQQIENAAVVRGFTNFAWHVAILILLTTAVFLLWHISRQRKKESAPTHPISQTRSDHQPTFETRTAEIHPTAKPPLLDSPDQTSRTQSRAIAPTAPGVTSNVHPDSRFFPKS
jgi:hypothetical protein